MIAASPWAPPFLASLARLQYAWRGWILGALFAALAWSRWDSEAPLAPSALLLVAAGSAYRLYAGRYIPGHSNSLALAGASLALRGPYRFGRHPLYLSNLAVIGGLILFAGSLPLWGAGALFLLALSHHAALARIEEGFLARAWGQAYADYLRATPRWLGLPRSNGAAAKGDTLRSSWNRQGANLGKTLACVLALWALAAIPK